MKRTMFNVQKMMMAAVVGLGLVGCAAGGDAMKEHMTKKPMAAVEQPAGETGKPMEMTASPMDAMKSGQPMMNQDAMNTPVATEQPMMKQDAMAAPAATGQPMMKDERMPASGSKMASGAMEPKSAGGTQ